MFSAALVNLLLSLISGIITITKHTIFYLLDFFFFNLCSLFQKADAGCQLKSYCDIFFLVDNLTFVQQSATQLVCLSHG